MYPVVQANELVHQNLTRNRLTLPRISEYTVETGAGTEVMKMKIVVLKMPGFLGGILRRIFKIR